MKYGRLIVLGGMLAALATPMFADTIFGTFDGSGQGTITTTGTGLTIGGTIGTSGKPTGTITDDGTGVFSGFSQSESFFYDFVASGTPSTAFFGFSTAGPAGIEFLQANTDPTKGPVTTMKFYITTVQDIAINSGATVGGTTGGFDGFGYVTFSNEKDPADPTQLFQEQVQYSLDVNKGSGSRPFTIEIDAIKPSPAPEPSSLALLGTGMLGVAGFAFRKRG